MGGLVWPPHRGCRCICGSLCSIIAILCVTAALILNEITKWDLKESSNADYDSSLIDDEDFKAYIVCGWDTRILCTGIDCADTTFSTGYTNLITPGDLPDIDSEKVNGTTTVDQLAVSASLKDLCDDGEDDACTQQNIGLYWLIILILSIVFGVCGSCAILAQIARKFATPCLILAAITTLASFIIFIILSNDQTSVYACWSDDNEFTIASSIILSVIGAGLYCCSGIMTCCLHKAYEEDFFSFTD